MTDFTCTNCNLQFSLPISGDDLRCPKCGQAGLAERLPDVLEEVDSAGAAEVGSTPSPGPAPKSKIPPRRPARTGAPAARRTTERNASPEVPRKRDPKLAIAGVGVVLALAAGYFAWNRGGDGGAADSSSAQTGADTPTPNPQANEPSRADAPPPSTGDPRADFAARKARLTPGDLAGRRELLEFCREHGLDDARGLLLREILLLDSEDDTARRSFGFSRHANESSPFHGRWLTKADAELAAAYDALLSQ